jgi:hypothetical protein
MTPPTRRGRPSGISTIGLTGAPATATPVATAPTRETLAVAASTPEPATPVRKEKRIAFTLRMPLSESHALARLALEIGEEAGARLTQSEIMGALIWLARNDAPTRDALTARIRDQFDGGRNGE